MVSINRPFNSESESDDGVADDSNEKSVINVTPHAPTKGKL